MVAILERPIEQEEPIEQIARLTRDLKGAARLLTPSEARYLVDLYYAIQDFRIQAGNQTRALDESGEPNSLVAWMLGNFHTLEGDIKRAMDAYSDSQIIGRWSKSIHGIGPVISGGLMAHIDIEKAATAGAIWKFAGLDPTTTWEKKQKRPWNARLKVLCWKIGQSFVKVSNSDKDFYGHVYKERKEVESRRNAEGLFSEQAARVLETKKIGRDTEAYKWYSQGMLPPAHIQARSERYAVKLFLSGWHECAYFAHYGALPPKPYILTKPEHAHYIAPPNMEMVPGWGEARAATTL